MRGQPALERAERQPPTPQAAPTAPVPIRRPASRAPRRSCAVRRRPARRRAGAATPPSRRAGASATAPSRRGRRGRRAGARSRDGLDLAACVGEDVVEADRTRFDVELQRLTGRQPPDQVAETGGDGVAILAREDQRIRRRHLAGCARTRPRSYDQSRPVDRLDGDQVARLVPARTHRFAGAARRPAGTRLSDRHRQTASRSHGRRRGRIIEGCAVGHERRSRVRRVRRPARNGRASGASGTSRPQRPRGRTRRARRRTRRWPGSRRGRRRRSAPPRPWNGLRYSANSIANSTPPSTPAHWPIDSSAKRSLASRCLNARFTARPDAQADLRRGRRKPAAASAGMSRRLPAAAAPSAPGWARHRRRPAARATAESPVAGRDRCPGATPRRSPIAPDRPAPQ